MKTLTINELKEGIEQADYILSLLPVNDTRRADILFKKYVLIDTLKSKLELKKEMDLMQQFIINTDKKIGVNK